MIDNPKVSVIIPTYKDWERLGICLEALGRQSYPAHDVEIIVVNNDPSNSAPFESQKNLVLLDEVKPGSYAARNKGLQFAKGQIIAFTDSDCIPDGKWIENAVNSFKSESNESKVVSGHIELFFKGDKPATLAEHYEVQFGFRHLATEKSRSKNLVTANAFVPRVLFDQVGLFNDKLFSGGDTDFAKRLLAKGVKIEFNEDVIIKHPARFDFDELLRKRKRVFGGKIRKKALDKGIEKSSWNLETIHLTWLELNKQYIKWKADRSRAVNQTKDGVNPKMVLKALNKIFYGTILEGITIVLSGKFKRR